MHPPRMLHMLVFVRPQSRTVGHAAITMWLLTSKPGQDSLVERGNGKEQWRLKHSIK
jgi:hypothetical protein